MFGIKHCLVGKANCTIPFVLSRWRGQSEKHVCYEIVIQFFWLQCNWRRHTYERCCQVYDFFRRTGLLLHCYCGLFFGLWVKANPPPFLPIPFWPWRYSQSERFCPRTRLGRFGYQLGWFCYTDLATLLREVQMKLNQKSVVKFYKITDKKNAAWKKVWYMLELCSYLKNSLVFHLQHLRKCNNWGKTIIVLHAAPF